MKVDLSKTRTFEPPAEGDYAGEIHRVDAGVTKAGDLKITVYWNVDDDSGVEKSVVQTVALAGPGAFRAEQLFIALGLADTREEVAELECELDDLPADLVGRTAMLRIEHRVFTEEEGGDGSLMGNVTRMSRIEGQSAARRGGLFSKR